MKTFTKVIIWIIVILVIAVLVSYLLPGKYYVGRSIVVDADKELIYDQFCDFNNWENWTPWGQSMDSTASYEIVGSPCEVGAIQSWTGNIVGEGQLLITAVVPNEKMEYELAFDGGKYKSDGSFIIEPQEDKFLLTWTDEGDLGYNPVARYMGLFMENMIGPDFEKGLSNLKSYVETLPDFPDIEVTEIESVPAVSITDSATMEQMSSKMGELYSSLMGYIAAKRAEITGPPYCVYYSWDPEGYTVMEAGVPVDKKLAGKMNIKGTMSPGGKAIKVLYVGPYEGLESIYLAMDKYVKINNMEIAGGPWEVYLTDPSTEPDSSKWQTMVYFPVK